MNIKTMLMGLTAALALTLVSFGANANDAKSVPADQLALVQEHGGGSSMGEQYFIFGHGHHHHHHHHHHRR